MNGTPLHPAHDELARQVRFWYVSEDVNLGKVVEKRAYGYYSRIIASNYCDVHIVEPFPRSQVPAFLADVRAFYGERSVKIFPHDPTIRDELESEMLAAGCVQGSEKVYLAHVGDPPQLASGPAMLEPVFDGNLLDYQLAKLKGFADSEADPDPADVETGLALRRAEMNADGRFLIARLGAEAAGILGWYEGKDRLLFHLATRVPFRNRGIARQLLSHVVADSYAQSKRSVLIFTDPADTPVQFYRRMEFLDEIYWMGQWTFNPKIS